MIAARIPKNLTCPYLAIPIPGERPFIVERRMYQRVTKGLNITDTSLERINDIWQLTIVHNTVYGVGRRPVRGRFVFYNLAQTRFHTPYMWRKFRETMAAWAEKQRKARSTAKLTPEAAKIAPQIRRLQREMEGLRRYGESDPPQHPYCYPVEPSGEYERSLEARWRNQRAARKQIAQIAVAVLARKLTNATAYRKLREMGYAVRTISQLRVDEKRQLGSENIGRKNKYCAFAVDDSAYWKNLYRFCIPDVARRYRFGKAYDSVSFCRDLQEHARRRKEFLQTRRELRSLQSQIDSLQRLAGFKPVMEENVHAAAA